MSTVSARGLAKSFGTVVVLDQLDLEVASGEVLAVLGPSGCGKTTLLRVLAGFERPDAGEIRVDGALVAGPSVHVPPHRRGLAVVPQEGALFPHLTVAANVGFGLPRSERRGNRVGELLEMAGLATLADRMPHELSGGQQQRTAVARALAPAPSVVLLDEPFSGLDAGLRATIRGEVLGLLRATGSTAVLVTHDQEEALSLADRIAIMRDGRIVQQSAPHEAYGRPTDVEVARFLGDANVLDGTVLGDSVTCALGRLHLREPVAAGPVRVLIRPEQIELGGPAGATVVERRYYGHDAMLAVRLASGEMVRVRTTGQAPVDRGSEVGLSVGSPVICYPAASS